MSATEVLFRAHDYPDISPTSKASARTRHRPHRTPRTGRRTVIPAHEAAPGVCSYSPSCFTCLLPDCRQPANVCLGVNNIEYVAHK